MVLVPLLPSTVEGSSGTNTMTYTRGSRYSFWDSWGWALWRPKHVEFDVAVNKCPHTAASSWSLLLTLNHDARNHEFKKIDIKLFHDFTVFLDVTPCGLVYSLKNVFQRTAARSWVHRYTVDCESRSYHSLISLLAGSCLIVDAGGSLLVASSAVNFEQQKRNFCMCVCACVCVSRCGWERGRVCAVHVSLSNGSFCGVACI
jgi:hypothetical protein